MGVKNSDIIKELENVRLAFFDIDGEEIFPDGITKIDDLIDCIEAKGE